MPSERLETKLRRLVDAKRRKKETKAAATEAEKAHREEEAACYQELEEEYGDVTSITIDLGPGYGKHTFVRQSRVYGKVFNEDLAFESLDNEALSDELTAPKVSESALNQLVQERVRNGQPLPDGITFRTRNWITDTQK